jgi:hypothetical protein
MNRIYYIKTYSLNWISIGLVYINQAFGLENMSILSMGLVSNRAIVLRLLDGVLSKATSRWQWTFIRKDKCNRFFLVSLEVLLLSGCMEN